MGNIFSCFGPKKQNSPKVKFVRRPDPQLNSHILPGKQGHGSTDHDHDHAKDSFKSSVEEKLIRHEIAENNKYGGSSTITPANQEHDHHDPITNNHDENNFIESGSAASLPPKLGHDHIQTDDHQIKGQDCC
uniref:Uncharacterized protein n=1 Tax=Cannabis sativa TaxID=3483 RepID=A0A803Q4V8_CANSA